MVRQIMKYLPFKLFKLKYHSGLKFVKCQRKTLFIMRPSFTYLHWYFTLQFCLRRDYILRIKNRFYILVNVYRTINEMHLYCKFVFLLKEVFVFEECIIKIKTISSASYIGKFKCSILTTSYFIKRRRNIYTKVSVYHIIYI